MKNIHVLPTDKPSRLYIGDNLNFVFGMIQTSIQSRNDYFTNQHIYITSDEEIKEGDWCLCSEELIHKVVEIKSNIGIIRFQDGVTEVLDACKKIILTTDELYIHNDLIPKEYNLFPQYIQKIDDEFLEWFCKNPSCEEVEVIKARYDGTKSIDKYWGGEYKIIIPRTTQQIIDEDFSGGLDIGQILPKQDINTCKNFDRETGCDLVDCLCENQKILSEAKKRAKQKTLEDIELEEVRGSRHCQFSVVENKLAIIYRNQLKILQAIKMLNNER